MNLKLAIFSLAGFAALVVTPSYGQDPKAHPPKKDAEVPTPTDFRPKVDTEEGWNPEIFRSSFTASLQLSREGYPTVTNDSRLTLLGLHDEGKGRCRFVFATTAHGFVAKSKTHLLKSLTFSTGKYLEDATSIEFLAHPKFIYGADNVQQYDIAMLSLIAECPYRKQIRPFPVVRLKPGASCRFFTTSFRYIGGPLGDDGREFRSDGDLKSTSFEGEKKDGLFYFRQKASEMGPGHSGSGAFCYQDGNIAWSGVLVGGKEKAGYFWTTGNDDDVVEWVKDNVKEVVAGKSMKKAKGITVAKPYDPGVPIDPKHVWESGWGY